MNNSVLPMVSSASPERGGGTSMDLAYSDFFFIIIIQNECLHSEFYSIEWYRPMVQSAWLNCIINQERLRLYWIVALIKFKFIQEIFILWILFSNKNLKLLNLTPEKQQKQVWMTRNKNIAIDPSEQSQCPKALRAFTAWAPWLNTLSPGGGGGKHKLLALMDF